jgi:lipid-A-disaccharide synthase
MKSGDAAAPFAPPSGGRSDILFIAGEHSGDQHAALLVAEIRRRRPDLAIHALGGERMQAAGAELLFDLTRFSVIGIAEVLKHLSVFSALLARAQEWIAAYRPKVVCFVDYPGFNLRLAGRLFDVGLAHKAGGPVALYYYISPQIWAWKKGRRFSMARLLDSLAVIFPFEVSCYADTDLPVHFTGHPFVAEGASSRLFHDPAGPVLLLPGSRAQPVGRIYPAMLAGFARYRQAHPGEKALTLYPDERIKALLLRILTRFPELEGAVELRSAPEGAGAKACLLSSGTMSLSSALAGIPGAICYKAHPLTYWFGRLVVKIPHLGIANLLLPEAPPYPEYIQGAAHPGALAREIDLAANDPARTIAAARAAAELRRVLSADKSHDLAGWLLSAPGL